MDNKIDTENGAEAAGVLLEISHAVLTTVNPDDLYPFVCASLKKILNFENFAVVLYHKEKDSVIFPYISDEMGSNPGEIFGISQKQSLIVRVMDSGKSLILDEEDIRKISSGRAEPLIRSGCKTWAGVPLNIKGRAFGALIVQNYHSKGAFNKSDFDVLASAARLISVAIERQQLQSFLKQSNEINEVQREITRAIHSSENLYRLFEMIHHALGRIIDVSNFYIGLYEKKINTITFPFFRDEFDDVTMWDVDYLKTNSLTYEVFQALKPVLLKKQDLDILAEQKRILGTVPRIWLGIPLMTKTEPIGVMVTQSYSDPEAFNQQDVDFLCAVSEQIAAAVEHKQSEEALKKSEAKYRALFDTMPNGFYTSSPEGYIIDANPAFVKMLGYDSLHESEERFRTLIDHSHDAVIIHEPDGRIIDVNKTMLKMFDVSHAEALTYTIDDYTGPESSIMDSQNNWMRALAGEDVLFPWQARRPKDGSLFDVEVYLTRILSGKRKLILFNVRDITEQKKAEKALRASEEKYRLLFENSVEGIYQTTPAGRILSVNPAFLRIFEFDSQEELFLHFNDIGKQQYVNPGDRDNFKKMIEEKGVVNAFETQLLKKDGTPIWVSMNARTVRDDAGVLLYYEGFLQNITDRKKAQEELYRISIHDHLTGICNRRYIFERLDAMVNEYQRETRHFSLSIIDLDHFKKINDTHGHQAGDFILREFASMLSECSRPYDLVGRYGGEEFVVVAMNIDILQTQNMFERLQDMVRDRVFDFNGTQIRIAFSAGVANTGETGLEMTVENLIRKADERLYLAKAQGRDRIIYE